MRRQNRDERYYSTGWAVVAMIIVLMGLVFAPLFLLLFLVPHETR